MLFIEIPCHLRVDTALQVCIQKEILLKKDLGIEQQAQAVVRNREDVLRQKVYKSKIERNRSGALRNLTTAVRITLVGMLF